MNLAEFALAKQRVVKLEDMVFSLRKSNAAYKREAEKLEWREAAQFDRSTACGGTLATG